MAKYKVPVIWQMYGYVVIEANSEEEALEIAQETQNEFSLPDDGEYLDESFEVDSVIDGVTKLTE